MVKEIPPEQIRICFILSDKDYISSWYAQTIQEVKSLDFVDITFLYFQKNAKQNYNGKVIYNKFRQFENWWFKNEYDAEEKIRIDTILSTEKYIEAVAGDSFLLSDELLSQLTRYKFDLFYAIDFYPSQEQNISK